MMKKNIMENRQLKYPNCSGEMKYDFKVKQLICCSCNTKINIDSNDKSVIELHDATAHIDRHFDIIDSVEVIHCKSCGGTEIVDPNATYRTCSFCDSKYVLTEQRNGVNAPK